ncbi:MAG: hypothetical protein EOP62_23135 [Sphingomonadales bacterium]|nr:MAG: hypothetical protein EOP62_23135 [Sphingomonadales bacterium]
MATMVLTVAGTLIGGPVGGAIGGMLGNAIDREILFKPKGREGPRLSELKLQTSSYGTQIPKLFGTMRVAGSVIWATDLIEHRSTTGGGKGRPGTTNYSYTASFAVALSARAILSVGRIWADGKLLRGAGGDWKARTGFRLHLGDEDQAADPLIAAAEGVGMAPAHRGIAYAVFENLELADFGNRIPSLTFEVRADTGAVSAGAVLVELAGGDVASGDTTTALAGFSAHGASVRAVAETLAGATGAWFRSDAGPLALLRGEGEAAALDDLSVRARTREGGAGRRAIAAADSAPRTLTLTHYDPAREYQSGMQRAGRPGAGTREARLELPAAIDAGAAKTIAEAALARMDGERERRSVSMGWDRIGVRPGERVTIAGTAGLWRVDRWSLEAMVLQLECVRVNWGAPAAVASGGRVLAAADVTIGETVLHAFELPAIDEVLSSAPRLAIAAAGTGAGWRSAALLSSVDDGAHWTEEGATAPAAVLGEVVVAPGVGSAALEDRVNAIEVALAHDAMLLGDADAMALDAGANLAMVGEELVQFARAAPLGGARWRLSGLWRGRRGTEAAIGGHAAGERFVLIDARALAVRPLSMGAIGSTFRVLAQGVGESGDAAESEAPITGRGIVPPSPAHFGAEILGDGSVQLNWVRRSRIGWRWSDGMDAPLGEERERYRIFVTPEEGNAWTVELAAPGMLLPPEIRTSALHVAVRQSGTHGLSLPATLSLPAIGDA